MKRLSGYILFELTIVMLILSILMTASYPRYTSATKKAHELKLLANDLN